MSTINTVWANGNLPIRDGLYIAGGRSFSARINPDKPGGLEILDEFDLDALLASDPDWVTTIDVTRRVELPNGASLLCCGEGSYGSEGFFARLNNDGNLIWVVYLEQSNPFIGITISGNTATFTSSSDVAVSVDIDHPWIENKEGGC